MHIHYIYSLNEQIWLSLMCLDVIISRIVCCAKTKKRLQFDLVTVIVGKRIFDDEKIEAFQSRLSQFVNQKIDQKPEETNNVKG